MTALRPDLPETLDALFRRALAPDVAQRLSSVEELASALRRITRTAAGPSADRKTQGAAQPSEGRARASIPWVALVLTVALFCVTTLSRGKQQKTAPQPQREVVRSVASAAGPADAEPPAPSPEAGFARQIEAGEASSPEPPVPNGPAPMPPLVSHKPAFRAPSEAMRKQLVAAIDAADRAEVLALRRGNPSGLSAIYVGEPLRNVSAAVAELKRNGLYKVNELRQRDVESVLISADQGRAKVRMNEVWEGWLLNARTHACQRHLLAHAIPQTVHLIHKEQRWWVSRLEFATPKPPVAVACQ